MQAFINWIGESSIRFFLKQTE